MTVGLKTAASCLIHAGIHEVRRSQRSVVMRPVSGSPRTCPRLATDPRRRPARPRHPGPLGPRRPPGHRHHRRPRPGGHHHPPEVEAAELPRPPPRPKDEDERARFAAYAPALRVAEAVTVRTHLTSVLGGDGTTLKVILAGDLNDGVDAATTQILKGPPGSELGTPGFGHLDHGGAQWLWNLVP